MYKLFSLIKGVRWSRGTMMLAKGVRMSTLFQLDAYTIHWKSSSISTAKRAIKSTPLQSKLVPTFDGHALWVRKRSLASESNLYADMTMLWHQKLGYIGEKEIQALENKNLVDGLNDCALEFDFCGHCIYGKCNCV